MIPDARLDGGGLWSDVKTCITTASGEKVDPLHFFPEDLDINDIAHSLARQCRYNGHVGYFLSVARHSLWVSEVLNGESTQLQLHGLLHDAAEAYLGDLVRPLKHGPTFGDAYRVAEAAIEQAIAEKWGFGYPWPERITEADTYVLLERELSGPLYRWTWQGSYATDHADFIRRYRQLTTRLSRGL